MAPEHDLQRMLATLDVQARAGAYAFVVRATDDSALARAAQAIVREADGITYVVPAADATTEDSAFRAAWLTLGVASALDAVGLTAAVSTALAARGIACNVIAGFHHDHLLVPLDRRDDALAALSALAAAAGDAA